MISIGYPRWLHNAITAPRIPTAPARPAAAAPVGLAAPPVELALDVEGVDTRVTLLTAALRVDAE